MAARKAGSSEKNQAISNKSNQSNGRGGARKGAGRKVGSATKRTREIADKAAAEGVTPLEVMLRTMNALVKQAEVDPKKPDLKLLTDAAAVAKDAAPYMHPRLAAVEHTGPNGGPMETVSRIELVAPGGCDSQA